MVESFEVIVHCVCYEESIKESQFISQGYESMVQHISHFNQFMLDTTDPLTRPSIVSIGSSSVDS